jgi:hypothetical protein
MNKNIPLDAQVREKLNGSTVAASATLQTGWVDVRGCSRVRIEAYVGATTSTTAFTVTQATSAAGAGEKAANSAGQLGATLIAASDLPFADDDDTELHVYDIMLAEADMDVDNGFYFISAIGTVTGGTSQDMAIHLMAYPIPYTTTA